MHRGLYVKRGEGASSYNGLMYLSHSGHLNSWTLDKRAVDILEEINYVDV